MKKIIINIVLVLIIFLLYFLQADFFSWFTIAGVMPNLMIILVLFIGLFSSRTMGTIYGISIGLFLDFIMGYKIGIYAVSLGLIGFLAGVFDRNFSKNSRMTIMFMVAGSTIVFEILTYVINIIFISPSVEIINFILILLVETIYNVLLTVILYPVIKKFGYYIENEFKGNKILTRYF